MNIIQVVIAILILLNSINVANANEWQIASPEDVAMDSQLLVALEKALDQPNRGNKHSFLIIKDNKIVFESYRRDTMALVGYEIYKDINYTNNTPHLLFN